MRKRTRTNNIGHEDELPRRLRQLRHELGLSLEDLVPIVGVAQKGVISNWEATNQRRRTPEWPTLFLLQRFYGVSLDYLVGNPKAERDSPEVKAAKETLRNHLKDLGELRTLTPSDRARLALGAAFKLAPDAYFHARAAAYLQVSAGQFEDMLEGAEWPTTVVCRLTTFLGVDQDWLSAKITPAAENRVQVVV